MNYHAIASLVDEVESLADKTSVIGWAPPVPFFGRLDQAVVATVGINPSSLEFIDGDGLELTGDRRRLPTLQSLELDSWQNADAGHLRMIVTTCLSYFETTPYGRWFAALERVVAPLGVSFYDAPRACHLDVVPFTTAVKWGALANAERRLLLRVSEMAIAELVRSSSIETLILNGRSVVELFGQLLAVPLEVADAQEWRLARGEGGHVRGLRFHAEATNLAGVDLGRRVRVLGFNHNLQSSFGVTSSAVGAIGTWLREATSGMAL